MKPALSARGLRVERPASGFVLSVDALDLHAGEVLAVLGPNGAGKSTLLRALAGLERAAGVVDTPDHAAVTMVFQRPVAFAGSVEHNVRVALSGRGIPRDAAAARVEAALDHLGIGALADRRAQALSGGELRRVALARAFVLQPAVLLLDEPFDDLDAAGQAALTHDLRRVIAETGVAVAMVTHDLRRALLLADRIAVLQQGRLAQVGPRSEVLDRPASPAVARGVGMLNLLEGRIAHDAGGAFVVIDGAHRLPVGEAPPDGAPVVAGIRPEHLRLGAHGADGALPIGEGVVRSALDDGATVTLTVAWGDAELVTWRLSGRGRERLLAPGDRVALAVRPDDVHAMLR